MSQRRAPKYYLLPDNRIMINDAICITDSRIQIKMPEKFMAHNVPDGSGVMRNDTICLIDTNPSALGEYVPSVIDKCSILDEEFDVLTAYGTVMHVVLNLDVCVFVCDEKGFTISVEGAHDVVRVRNSIVTECISTPRNENRCYQITNEAIDLTTQRVNELLCLPFSRNFSLALERMMAFNPKFRLAMHPDLKATLNSKFHSMIDIYSMMPVEKKDEGSERDWSGKKSLKSEKSDTPTGVLKGEIHLRLNDDFDMRIPLGIIPEGITHLIFGKSFDQEITTGVLPRTLTHIVFGEEFDNDFSHGVLHQDIRYIKFGDNFSQDLKPGVLPKNLLEITFGKHFSGLLPPGILPHGLESIKYTDGMQERTKSSIVTTEQNGGGPASYPSTIKSMSI